MRDLRTIKNSVYVSERIFKEIKKHSEWSEMCELVGVENLPILNGLDDIIIRENGIFYTDIGCNGKDNSFAIRIRKES